MPLSVGSTTTASVTFSTAFLGNVGQIQAGVMRSDTDVREHSRKRLASFRVILGHKERVHGNPLVSMDATG